MNKSGSSVSFCGAGGLLLLSHKPKRDRPHPALSMVGRNQLERARDINESMGAIWCCLVLRVLSLLCEGRISWHHVRNASLAFTSHILEALAWSSNGGCKVYTVTCRACPNSHYAIAIDVGLATICWLMMTEHAGKKVSPTATTELELRTGE